MKAEETPPQPDGSPLSAVFSRKLPKWAKLALWLAGLLAFAVGFALLMPFEALPWYVSRCLFGYWGLILAAAVYLAATICWLKRAFFHRKNNYRISACVLSVCVSLVFLELAVRFICPRPKFLSVLPTVPNLRERRTSIDLRGVSPRAVHSTNEWGLRGDPVPGNWETTSTILTIGGSTTRCLYLDNRKTWPYLLQKHLKEHAANVWVGNAGFNGHTTRGHLLVMDFIVAKVRPKALVFLVGVNDLALSLDEKARTEGSHYDKARYLPRRWKHPLDRLRTFHLVRQWKALLLDGATRTGESGHRTQELRPFDPGETTPIEEELTPPLPSLPEYRTNLIALIEKGRELRCQMLFLTQPMLYGDGEYWEGIQGAVFFIKNRNLRISAAAYWRMLGHFNAMLIRVCKEHNVPCLDLASKIPHSPDYFYDMVHFTEAGAALVAEHAASAVLESFSF